MSSVVELKNKALKKIRQAKKNMEEMGELLPISTPKEMKGCFDLMAQSDIIFVEIEDFIEKFAKYPHGN